MADNTGLAIVSLLVLVCTAGNARAGCPAWGSVDTMCDSNASSINSCTNAILSIFHDVAIWEDSLKKYPDHPADRIDLLNKYRGDLVPKIRLLGAARDYDYDNDGPSCDVTWDGIENCENSLRTARNGLDLILKPQLVANLSAATRERVARIMRQHEVEYTAKLDMVAASGRGNSSQLCNTNYASVAGCERAIAADRAAQREQVFPVIRCGRVVPGQFVTAKDAAAEERNGPRYMGLTFGEAVSYYRFRLDQEIGLLEKLKLER